MANPLYTIGEVLYFKESAALGFLEAIRINGVHLNNTGWVYSVEAKAPLQATPALYGDRVSLVNNATLYFSEDEFLTLCDALLLIEANLTRKLGQIQAQRASFCPDEITG